jgi:hypothetical protein
MTINDLKDIKFNVHIYPFTENEIFQNKGIQISLHALVKTIEKLKNF